MTSLWDTPFRQMLLNKLPVYAYKDGKVDLDFRKMTLRQLGFTLIVVVIIVSVMVYA